MKRSYSENVTGIGNLYLEYVFYEFEQEPVLFLCRDEYANIYLCLCADIRYEQSWIVVPCNTMLLHLLIEEKMDIASVFLSRKNGWKIVMDIHGNEKNESIQMNDIDRLDLPKEGTYIRCDKEKAETYLWKRTLEEEMKCNYNIVNESDMNINSLEAA